MSNKPSDEVVRELIERYYFDQINDTQFNFLIRNSGATKEQVERVCRDIDNDGMIGSFIIGLVLFGIGVFLLWVCS